MHRRHLLILYTLILLVIATACSGPVKEEEEAGAFVSTVKQQQETLPATSNAAYTKDEIKPRDSYGDSWKKNPEGSMGLLSGKNILISIYVSDDYSGWTTKEIAQTQEYLQTALSFIETQAGIYNSPASFVYGTDEPFFVDMTYDGELSSDGVDYWQVNQAANEWIEKNVDARGLLKEYEAEGIGFLLFINKPGICYSDVYFMGYDDSLYYEKCVLYTKDYGDGETNIPAATYAHEVLHLFGAPDLYSQNFDDGITGEFVTHVGSYYSEDIMYSTRNDDPGIIGQEITDITAYFLGWADTLEELRTFPTLERLLPGCFYFRAETYYEDCLSEEAQAKFYFSHRHRSSLYG